MSFDEIYNDVDNIRITEFMEAIGEKPVKREGDILTYNAPYNIEELSTDRNIHTKGKPTCLVDTRRNVWRDRSYTPWQPLTMLMLEISGTYNLASLKAMIAKTIQDHRMKQDSVREEKSPNPRAIVPKRKMRF